MKEKLDFSGDAVKSATPDLNAKSSSENTMSSAESNSGLIIEKLNEFIQKDNHEGLSNFLSTIHPKEYIPGLTEKIKLIQDKYPQFVKINRKIRRIIKEHDPYLKKEDDLKNKQSEAERSKSTLEDALNGKTSFIFEAVYEVSKGSPVDHWMVNESYWKSETVVYKKYKYNFITKELKEISETDKSDDTNNFKKIKIRYESSEENIKNIKDVNQEMEEELRLMIEEKIKKLNHAIEKNDYFWV